MLAIAFSLPIIALALAVGVFVPWLGLHLELIHRVERRNAAELAARARIIEDQQATINAYRQLVVADESFWQTTE